MTIPPRSARGRRAGQIASHETPPGRGVILCADDYGYAPGVSAAITELADAGRLSATSAIVTLPDWPAQARQLARWREVIAVGLHLNLTFGQPLARMPRLAPGGMFSGISGVLRASLTGRLDVGEVRAEALRQLALFEAEVGFPPDFLDGHHHVHVLPGVRGAVLDALSQRFPNGGVLVRDPTDTWTDMLRRPAKGKAAFIACLASGFAHQAKRRGLIVNDGFAGFSSFAAGTSFDRELDSFLAGARRGRLVMCHPGHSDPALAGIDSLGSRRQEEFDVLSRRADMPSWLWRPSRDADGRCDWPVG